MHFMSRKQDEPVPEITEGSPPVATIARFYAELSQPAEFKAIEDAFFPTSKPEDTEIVVFHQLANGKLISLLRAWKNIKSKEGVLYEVTVHGTYRKRGLAKGLRNKLLENHKDIHWTGYPYRVGSDLDRSLTLIRTLYGIALVLGFQEIVRSIYSLFFENTMYISPSRKILLSCLTLVLSMLGLRFFWAVGNIRRFFLRRTVSLDPPSRTPLVVFHFPVLFSHAVLFFLLCKLFSAFSASLSFDRYALPFIAVYVVLLLVNSQWLCFLTTEKDEKPESLWFWNNVGFSCAACVVLAVAESRGLSGEVQLFVTSGLFIANSLIDMVMVSDAYVAGDAFVGG